MKNIPITAVYLSVSLSLSRIFHVLSDPSDTPKTSNVSFSRLSHRLQYIYVQHSETQQRTHPHTHTHTLTLYRNSITPQTFALHYVEDSSVSPSRREEQIALKLMTII